jgi:hypothetical protein
VEQIELDGDVELFRHRGPAPQAVDRGLVAVVKQPGDRVLFSRRSDRRLEHVQEEDQALRRALLGRPIPVARPPFPEVRH